LQEKFGRALQDRERFTYGFEADFRVESYLRHQGMTFVDRFDANSYLYLTRAASYFDLTEGGRKPLHQVFGNAHARFCVIAFSSDWLFPPAESRQLVRALNAIGANVSFAEIASDLGHDAFLLNEPDFSAAVCGFLHGSAAARAAYRLMEAEE
ncbi:MAG: homoserine O-acetyltransferase, partial [Alphaproteobacteria bacterium]|nr:homoserine O-acetyltransferase [Alphaproteobacteria bacterium]